MSMTYQAKRRRRRLAASWVLAAAVLAYPSATDALPCGLDFVARSQQKTSWCWAASVEMAMAAVDSAFSFPDQCDQATELLKSFNVNEPCCESQSVDCNVLAPADAVLWPSDTTHAYTWTAYDPTNIIPFSVTPGADDSAFTLVHQICEARKPVVFTWKECGGGYHMMVAKRIDRDANDREWVTFVNPSPVGGGGQAYKASYAKFYWGNSCTHNGGATEYLAQGRGYVDIAKP
jgi:hypothetical protein